MTYMLNIDINWDKTQSVRSYFLSQSMNHARVSSHLISIEFNARVFERANYYFNQTCTNAVRSDRMEELM